jgi:hypothetical protein
MYFIACLLRHKHLYCKSPKVLFKSLLLTFSCQFAYIQIDLLRALLMGKVSHVHTETQIPHNSKTIIIQKVCVTNPTTKIEKREKILPSSLPSTFCGFIATVSKLSTIRVCQPIDLIKWIDFIQPRAIHNLTQS